MADWMLTLKRIEEIRIAALDYYSIKFGQTFEDSCHWAMSKAAQDSAIEAVRKLLEHIDSMGLLVHKGERVGVCDRSCEACRIRQEVME